LQQFLWSQDAYYFQASHRLLQTVFEAAFRKGLPELLELVDFETIVAAGVVFELAVDHAI